MYNTHRQNSSTSRLIEEAEYVHWAKPIKFRKVPKCCFKKQFSVKKKVQFTRDENNQNANSTSISNLNTFDLDAWTGSFFRDRKKDKMLD